MRATPETVYLEHWMPGRARLRVPKPRTPAHVRKVAERVGGTQHVRGVTTNEATGSMLVRFDPDEPIDLIIDDMRVAGLEILSAVESGGEPILTQSTGGAVVRWVFGKANAKLHVTTGGQVDLRLLVPAIYLGLAVRNFMLQRGRLREASWYQLLYWAFDSFVKLHEEGARRGSAGTRVRLID